MGSGSSKDAWSGYTNALLTDTTQQTIVIPESEEKGASAIRRIDAAKDGFQMYLSDEDSKTEIDSGWKAAKLSFSKHSEAKAFGYRPFLDPEKDILQRGAYKFDTYSTVAKQVYATGNGMFS